MAEDKKSYHSLDPLEIDPPDDPLPVADGEEASAESEDQRQQRAAAAKAELKRLEEQGG